MNLDLRRGIRQLADHRGFLGRDTHDLNQEGSSKVREEEQR
jgi:hypothetical protein